MKKTFYLWLFWMFVCVACSTSPAPIAPTIPIETAAPIGRAQTRMPSPLSTITATPTPTVTPIPSANAPTNATAAPPQAAGQNRLADLNALVPTSISLALSAAQWLGGSYYQLSGPTQASVFAPGAVVRVEFFTAPTGTGATPQLEFVDTNGYDGWSWHWQTPRGGSHLWAEAVYTNGARISSPVLLISFRYIVPIGTVPPSPTPTCETHTAAVQVQPSAPSVQLGQQLVVQVTLLNQGCVALGLPKYTLRIHAPQGQPLFNPPQPESVTRSLAVAPGQSDSVDFVLQAAQIGSGALQADVSFEVHIGYPGPAYWGYATSMPVNIAVTSSLKPPDSDQPASGICDPAPGDVVTVNISADVSSPRCVKVAGHQRLQVVNTTDASVQVQLAQFNVQLQPGQAHFFDASFASYLAPGVHWLRVTSGSGPEIWLEGN